MAKRYDTAGLNLSQLKIPAPQILLPVAIGPLVSSGDEQQPQRPRNSNWFWIWLGIAGVCVLTIALVFAVFGREGDRYHYYYDGPIFAANRIAPDTPATCTVDEVFDDSTRMCIMQAHFPKAVAENIIDTKMDPCTDFYRHACGKWIDAHTNENRGFAGLSAVNSVAIRDIILDAKVSNLNALYASCESTLVDPASKRKQRQQHAIETKLTRDAILGRMLDPLVSVDDLPIVFARMDAAGYTVPVAFVMSSNPKGKGLLPMFAYNGFDAHDQDRDWVRTHFEEIYGSEGPRADQEAVRFIHMASALNVAVPSKAVMDTFAGWKNYVNGTDFEHDTMTWAQFKALTESTGSPFDWSVFVEEMSKTLSLKNLHFGEETQVWAFSREYFSWWHPELFSVEEWKTFITFSVLYQTHDFFPELPNDILFTTSKPVSPLYGRRFKKTRLSASAYGIGKRKSRKQQRWKGRRNGVNGPRDLDDGAVITTDDCIRAAKYMLPGILSKEFLNRKFEQSGEVIRTRVKLMVERIRDRFVRNIMETPWLDNATRVAQADKIRAIIPRVVHPTEWMEETFPLGREMDPSRYLRNVGIIQEERVRRNLALWSESNAGAACDARCRDRITPFGSPLFTVNAWNLITIPAGILQPPFFHDKYTEASAYATIGWVIAHELSHSEDANGILYDKDGALQNTWNETMLRKYTNRFARIVKEYDSPEGCNHENYGMQTLSENIADINGLRLAYEALFLDGTSTATTMADKREFFMAAAQMWCASYTQEALCDRSRDDVHAIAPYRVDMTYSHVPYFAEAHGCPVGSRMHRHAGERIVLFGQEANDYIAARRRKKRSPKK